MSEQQVEPLWTDDDIKESTHRSMEHHKGVGFVVQQWRVKSLIARVRDDWQADHDDMQAKLEAANARIAELEQWEDVKNYHLQSNLDLKNGKRKIVELHIVGQTITMRDSDDHAISIYAPGVRIQRRKEGNDAPPVG